MGRGSRLETAAHYCNLNNLEFVIHIFMIMHLLSYHVLIIMLWLATAQCFYLDCVGSAPF